MSTELPRSFVQTNNIDGLGKLKVKFCLDSEAQHVANTMDKFEASNAWGIAHVDADFSDIIGCGKHSGVSMHKIEDGVLATQSFLHPVTNTEHQIVLGILRPEVMPVAGTCAAIDSNVVAAWRL
eukprot:95130-Rhodomonas_salina.7